MKASLTGSWNCNGKFLILVVNPKAVDPVRPRDSTPEIAAKFLLTFPTKVVVPKATPQILLKLRQKAKVAVAWANSSTCTLAWIGERVRANMAPTPRPVRAWIRIHWYWGLSKSKMQRSADPAMMMAQEIKICNRYLPVMDMTTPAKMAANGAHTDLDTFHNARQELLA